MEHRGRPPPSPAPCCSDPLGTNQWDQDQPGFLEADTVAHCGASMAGQFANSLDCVDIATTWTEQRAVWDGASRACCNSSRTSKSPCP
ncbi:MAG: hypothetical protein IPI61_06145 [Syntrophaceae bacterium]|nr:hypothetical protein [Syntrophaceae bacterium]